MKITKRQKIINYIREFGSITSLDACRDLGIMQFAARIKELKQEGYKFKTEWESSKNRYGKKVDFKRFYLADMVAESMNHIPQL